MTGPSGAAPLAGRTALVTGSSRGIGAAIARRLALAGARVAVHGRDAEARAAVAGAIRQQGGSAIEVGGDVTRPDQVEAMRVEVERQLGPVDILVANAAGHAVGPGVPIEQISLDDWRADIDANLTATFLTIRAFLPTMKARGGGSIITISSAASRRPTARSPIPYTVAKGAVDLLVRTVALEAGPQGVRVNAIAPEAILTERNLDRMPVATQRELAGNHPLRRLGTPEDIAEAALFLAGDGAGWISGVILDVAGGSVLA